VRLQDFAFTEPLKPAICRDNALKGPFKCLRAAELPLKLHGLNACADTSALELRRSLHVGSDGLLMTSFGFSAVAIGRQSCNTVPSTGTAFPCPLLRAVQIGHARADFDGDRRVGYKRRSKSL
jgi:hypothetical protein